MAMTEHTKERRWRVGAPLGPARPGPGRRARRRGLRSGRVEGVLFALALVAVVVGSSADATAANGTFPLNAPIVGMAATPDGGGYWLVGSDGGVFTFGDARFHGSAAGLPLAGAIVGIAATPDGGGYWLVGSDGGVFTGGDAHFYGSEAGLPLTSPVVGMAATPDGSGYWLVAADGGVFTFGDAHFYGSEAGHRLNGPVVGMAATPDGGGYWLAAADGGVFTFGDAHFHGTSPSRGAPVVGMASPLGVGGYRLAGADGSVFDSTDDSTVTLPPNGPADNPPSDAPEVPVAIALPVIVLVALGATEGLRRRRRSGRTSAVSLSTDP